MAARLLAYTASSSAACRVHPDRGDQDQVGDVGVGITPVGDGVGHPAGHAGLGRAPRERAVAVGGDGGLVDEQGRRLDREARLEDGQERGVAGASAWPGRWPRRCPTGPSRGAEDGVDVGGVRALADERLADLHQAVIARP